MPGGRLRAGRETVWSSCQLARSILTSWRSENSVQVGGGGASRPPSHRNPHPSCSMQAATRPSGYSCWMPRHWQLRSWSSGARGQAGVSVSQCWIAQDLEGSIGEDTGKEQLSGFAYSLGFFSPSFEKQTLLQSLGLSCFGGGDLGANASSTEQSSHGTYTPTVHQIAPWTSVPSWPLHAMKWQSLGTASKEECSVHI